MTAARPVYGSPELRALTVFAANVARLRVERDWTQGELAARADVSQSTVSFIERRAANCTVTAAWRIAMALGTTLDALFSGSTAGAEAPR